MYTMTKRDKKQEEIRNLILQVASVNNSLHHTVIAATGFGKSLVVIRLLEPLQKVLNFKKVLIIGNSENLRDRNWKEDFAKWGKSEVYDTVVETVTYQTAYKWNKDLSDYLIIADECDFAFGTPEYSKFFLTYKNCNILAITGYVADGKRRFMNEHLPAIVEYNLQQAQDDGVVNKTPIVFVKYDLSKVKNRKVDYESKEGRKTFYQSENSSYEYWDNKFIHQTIKMEDAQTDALLTGNYTEYNKWKNIRDKYTTRKRADILYSLDTAAALARQIVEAVKKKDDTSKVITFTARTALADKISKISYHYKNSDAINAEHYNGFNLGKYRELSLVGKVNRSDNLVGVNYAVLATYNGSDTIFNQRRGRVSRLHPEDFATIYILIPYYYKKVLDKETNQNIYRQTRTAAYHWVMGMLKGWDIDQVKVRDLRQIKSDL